MAVEHYEELLALYGRDMGVRHARKHLAAYADQAQRFGFALPPDERVRLVTSVDPVEVAGLLRRLFEECPARQLSEAA